MPFFLMQSQIQYSTQISAMQYVIAAMSAQPVAQRPGLAASAFGTFAKGEHLPLLMYASLRRTLFRNDSICLGAVNATLSLADTAEVVTG